MYTGYVHILYDTYKKLEQILFTTNIIQNVIGSVTCSTSVHNKIWLVNKRRQCRNHQQIHIMIHVHVDSILMYRNDLNSNCYLLFTHVHVHADDLFNMRQSLKQ